MLRCEQDAERWLTQVALLISGFTSAHQGRNFLVGMPSRVRPASPMWQGATFQTRMPLLADQAQLGLFSIGDIALLGGGILIVAICMRQTLERARQEDGKKTDYSEPFRL